MLMVTVHPNVAWEEDRTKIGSWESQIAMPEAAGRNQEIVLECRKRISISHQTKTFVAFSCSALLRTIRLQGDRSSLLCIVFEPSYDVRRLVWTNIRLRDIALMGRARACLCLLVLCIASAVASCATEVRQCGTVKQCKQCV
jgi:hypothetical protein